MYGRFPPKAFVTATLAVGTVTVCAAFVQAAPGASASAVGCAQRAETSEPTVFNDPRYRKLENPLVLGPIQFNGVKRVSTLPSFTRVGLRDGYYQVKVTLIVKASRRLELRVIGLGSSTPVLLDYGSAAADSSLRITSCSPTTAARSRSGVVGSGTIFTGTFEVPAPECVAVTIANRATIKAWRGRLPFGHACV